MRPTFFGFNPPFLTNTQVLPQQTDIRLIKNDVKQLLLTIPGERVMRPDFGSQIPIFVFEPGEEQGFFLLENSIRAAIAQFDSRITIELLNIDDSRVDENLITITLIASVRLDDPDNVRKQFEIEIAVPAGVEGGPPANMVVV